MVCSTCSLTQRVTRMAALKHDHKLKKYTYPSGNEVYFCALPDCTYKVKVGLALGKKVVCWRCGNPFVLSDYSLRLVKPHCQNCHRHKQGDVGAWVGPPSGEAYEEIGELVKVIEKENAKARDVESSLRDRLNGVVRAVEEEGEI